MVEGVASSESTSMSTVRFDLRRRIIARKLIKHYVQQARRRRRAMSTEMVKFDDFAQGFEREFEIFIDEAEFVD